MKNKSIILIAILVILLVLASLTTTEKKETKKGEEDKLWIEYNVEGNETNLDQYETKNPVVALYIEKYGSVVIELYPKIAPNTVNNFISLVKDGFYDNNTFHRLVPGFVLQGGDPTGTGTGGPGYTIKGEFAANDFENNLRHKKGIVSMARSSDYDSAGSQFFIMLATAAHLDDEYAAFGKVIDGWDNIKNIVDNEKVADEASGQLKNNLVLKKALIDLKDNDIKEVKKITD